MSKLSENLTVIRMIRGLSIRQVAQLTHRSPSTISNWESGRISPDADALENLCTIYKVTPNELLGWDPCALIEDFVKEQEAYLAEIEELKKQKSEIDRALKEYYEKLSYPNQ